MQLNQVLENWNQESQYECQVKLFTRLLFSSFSQWYKQLSLDFSKWQRLTVRHDKNKYLFQKKKGKGQKYTNFIQDL